MTRSNIQRYTVVTAICLAMVGSSSLVLAKKGKGGGSKTGGSKSSQQNNNQTSNDPPTTSPSELQDQEIQKATESMTAAETKAKKAFESSADWTAAEEAVSKSQLEYTAASTAVISKMGALPDYAAAAAKVTADEQKLDQARAGGVATSADVGPAATDLLAARSALGTLQTQALTSDPPTVTAKQNLSAANAALMKLRKAETAAVQADPDYQAAKKTLDDARSKVASASK